MEELEIRNMRIIEGRWTTDSVVFRNTEEDRETELQLSTEKWIAMGSPTYIVVSVRSEKHVESTQ